MTTRRTLTAAIAAVWMLGAAAQHIDINNSSNRTEDGYVGWTFANATTASTTVDGITVTLGIEGSTAGKTLKCEWWKDGVNKYSKLTSDGVGVYGHSSDGNTPQLQSGAVGLTVTLKGLSAGEHSLTAYHNNPSGYSGPKLNVYVDGELKAEGIAQTNRAQKPSESGKSMVTFTATADKEVVIIYRTTPEEGHDYTQGYETTSLFINSLDFDMAALQASDPVPANLDLHADCDGGRVVLSWKAAEGTAKHLVRIADSEGALDSATPVYEGSETTCTLSREFNPNMLYYWRVDAVDNEGTAYKGQTWVFQPRRLAFPGAEGYGRFAIGGRGGTVYHVTSLADDADNPQPGTLRYGLTKMSGPRTIVFDVAGEIYLKARLTCSDPYVTIAGQTAPGAGIMLRGAPLGMATDGITRFIRMRRGHILDDADANRGLDGLGMAGNDNAIMDHCSISWTIDEGFSSRGAKNITLQHTLISEALNVAGHLNYPAGTAHGYAATIGGGENGGIGSSYHHNLLAHNEGRNWSMSGGLDGAGSYDGHHDMFNNVCYNWGNRATDGGTHEGQFVNNYYKMGPATTKKILLEATLEGPHPGTQSYYVSGNIRENMDGTKSQDKEGDTYEKKVKAVHSQQWEVFVEKPFFESYATIETAEAAYQNVLSDVGCNQPAFDLHDQRMVSETLARTTSTVGRKSGKKGLPDHEDDAEGFNLEKLGIVTATRPADWDSDQDGIPDWFEKTVGTDPATANHNGDRDHDGYTDLEEYLNWLADPHFVVAVGQEVSIDLRPYFAGYKDFTIPYVPDLPNNGMTWWFTDADKTLKFKGLFHRLWTVHVTVSDPQTGVSLTRRFNFCITENAAEAIDDTRYHADNSHAAAYNLGGQRLSQPQRGVNISQGRKYMVQ